MPSSNKLTSNASVYWEKGQDLVNGWVWTSSVVPTHFNIHLVSDGRMDEAFRDVDEFSAHLTHLSYLHTHLTHALTFRYLHLLSSANLTSTVNLSVNAELLFSVYSSLFYSLWISCVDFLFIPLCSSSLLTYSSHLLTLFLYSWKPPTYHISLWYALISLTFFSHLFPILLKKEAKTHATSICAPFHTFVTHLFSIPITLFHITHPFLSTLFFYT